MKFNKQMAPLLIGGLIFIMVLLRFLVSENPSYLIWSSYGILFILMYFRGHKNFITLYLLTFLSLLLFSGLGLGVIFSWMLVYTSTWEYYVSIGIFLFYMIMFVYGYLHRQDPDFVS